MSLHKLFATDRSAELDGVLFTFQGGDGKPVFRVRLARAGGANTRYERVREREMEPYRRVKDLTPETRDRITRKVFAEAVALPTTWEMYEREGLKVEGNTFASGVWAPATPGTRTADGFVRGIAIHDDVVPGTIANAVKLFEELPGVFELLAAQAFDVDLYRAEDLEADSKN